MVAFTRFRAPLNSGILASKLSMPRSRTLTARGRSVEWMIWTALAAALAFTTSPAFPQAGVALVQVNMSVVAKGYRMSKLIGTTVSNDKSEKIAILDDETLSWTGCARAKCARIGSAFGSSWFTDLGAGPISGEGS